MRNSAYPHEITKNHFSFRCFGCIIFKSMANNFV